MKTALPALALLLAACTDLGGGNNIARPAEPEADLVVTAVQDGTRVSMRSGETIEVRLEANETTPYRWEIETAPAILSALGSRYAAEPGAERRTGAGGTRIFRFEAASPGEGELRFAHDSAGSDREPVGRFTIHVTVR